MDGLDEILKAEKQAAEIKKTAGEKAALIIRTAEDYRDEKMARTLSEGSAEARRLIRLAEAKAESEALKMKAEAEEATSKISSAAEKRLDAAASFIAERIARG